ncbi:MAG: hypothetical protein EA362_08815 [Saprospirales bacterium]|nr:MAG: hypothetical protein EA362_08815 [Saprospirales bacterium]
MFKAILFKELTTAIAEQSPDGSFPSGQNGPYFDEETPVRNTAHWLFTLAACYEREADARIKAAAENAIDYLLSEKARPMNAAFWIRKNPEKDFCNGVIGQAWVMESLIKAAEVFSREDCYKAAEQVFLLHHFDEQLFIWKRLNVDGSWNSPDPTFNHQLWMGAIAAQLSHTAEAREKSKSFFNQIGTKVRLYGDGIIQHVSPVTRLSISIKNPKKVVEGILGQAYYHLSKRKLRLKSSGYHAFNLYAFSLYYHQFSDHPFWESRKFRKMLKVTESNRFLKEQIGNKYSYPYNPMGLEMAYVTETFEPNKKEKIEYWLNKQWEFTGEKGKSIMTRDSADENTARARIYEASRLKGDYQLEEN